VTTALTALKMGAKGKTRMEFDLALQQTQLNNTLTQDGFSMLLSSIQV